MRSLAYFSRQLRDLLLTRGAAMLAIAALLLLPALLSDYSHLAGEPDFTSILGNAINGMSAFLIMVATYGVIGEDARRGYFRLLFSKAVSPVWYYAQAFVVAWIGFGVVLLGVVGAFALFVKPVWPTDALLDAHFGFLLLGGMIFGLSRFTRLDWLVGLMLMIFGDVLRDTYPAAESLKGKIFNVILPPSQLDIGDFFSASGAVHVGPVIWYVCYAGLFIILGLAAVRLVSFGTAR
jgi:hypothetical protein